MITIQQKETASKLMTVVQAWGVVIRRPTLFTCLHNQYLHHQTTAGLCLLHFGCDVAVFSWPSRHMIYSRKRGGHFRCHLTDCTGWFQCITRIPVYILSNPVVSLSLDRETCMYVCGPNLLDLWPLSESLANVIVWIGLRSSIFYALSVGKTGQPDLAGSAVDTKNSS